MSSVCRELPLMLSTTYEMFTRAVLLKADNGKPKSKYIPGLVNYLALLEINKKMNNIFIKWKLLVHLVNNSKGTSPFLKLKIQILTCHYVSPIVS